MAAHSFRAWLWDTEGFAVWNNQWYGGHHVPGYSLLFPPLAATLGAWVAVAAAGTFAAATLTALPRESELRGLYGTSARAHRAVGAWALAAGAASNVVVGRGPFVLGVAFGALALLALARSRPAGAALAAAATTWASPVAGLFLALILTAQLIATAKTAPRRTTEPTTAEPTPSKPPTGPTTTAEPTPSKPILRALADTGALPALATTTAAGALMLLPFPEGGSERFVATAFWPMLAVTLAATALIDPRRRTVRTAALLYAALLLGAFLVDTPVGQNATRLGTLAGPAVLVLAGRGPRVALLVTGAALLYLQWLPAYRAISEQRGDPGRHAAFHQPLLDFLDARAAPGDRVEIPLTRNHWEADHVARRHPIARGWERQLDVERNSLFYGDAPLTAARYERWLKTEQIRWVAVPRGVPLDFSATEEAELIRSEPPFLTLAARARGWTIYENPSVGPSPVTNATPTTLTVSRSAELPYRHTRYWRVAAGRGCVRESPAGRIATSGAIRIEARLSGPSCR